MTKTLDANLNIVDLGEFERYEPAPYPKNLPRGLAFCRRKADGKDWYALVHPVSAKRKAKLKAADSYLYATARPVEDGAYALETIHTDPERLFPQGCRVLQIAGHVPASEGISSQLELAGAVWRPADIG